MQVCLALVPVVMAYLDVLKKVQGKNVPQRLSAIVSVVQVALLQNIRATLLQHRACQSQVVAQQGHPKKNAQTRTKTKAQAARPDGLDHEHRAHH